MDADGISLATAGELGTILTPLLPTTVTSTLLPLLVPIPKDAFLDSKLTLSLALTPPTCGFREFLAAEAD